MQSLATKKSERHVPLRQQLDVITT